MNLKIPGAILLYAVHFWAPGRKLLGCCCNPPFGEVVLSNYTLHQTTSMSLQWLLLFIFKTLRLRVVRKMWFLSHQSREYDISNIIKKESLKLAFIMHYSDDFLFLFFFPLSLSLSLSLFFSLFHFFTDISKAASLSFFFFFSLSFFLRIFQKQLQAILHC